MNPVLAHILLPAISSVAFFALACTPVELLGCRTRGILALLIATTSGLLSLAAAIRAIKGRLDGEASSYLWIISSLVLVIPVIALLILA